MKTSAKKYCISVFSLLAAIILLFSVTACTARGQKDDAPADGGDPAFSGNNSDYTESVGYEEGSVEGADLAAAYRADLSFRRYGQCSGNRRGVEVGNRFYR